jgi:hypothetical protein
MPIVKGDRWRTSSRVHWQPFVRRIDHYSPRIPLGTRPGLQSNRRNHLREIHQPYVPARYTTAYNDPREDYGFDVVVVVGRSENVLHPSSKLLNLLKERKDLRNLPREKFDRDRQRIGGYKILDSSRQSIDGAKYYRRVHKQAQTTVAPNLEDSAKEDVIQIAEQIITTMNSRFGDESRDKSTDESGDESNTFTIKEQPAPIHCRFNPRPDIGGFDLSLSLMDNLGNPINSQFGSFMYRDFEMSHLEAPFYGWLPGSIKTLLDLHHKKLQAPAEV